MNPPTGLLSVVVLGALASSAIAATPDCSGVNRWATNMAFGALKNAGITNNDKVDFTKTKTVRLASEKIGKDLYRQVHLVTFTEKSGQTIEALRCMWCPVDSGRQNDAQPFVAADGPPASREC
jgi:hypothetical protein